MELSNINNISTYDASGNATNISIAKSELNVSLVGKYRDDLPIFELRNEIVQTINENPIVIIKGPTGCGKVCLLLFTQ
jgi:HrpA-like RNA helicase